MSLQKSLYSSADGDLAFASSPCRGSAADHACELLSQDGNLTLEQFRELDRIFRRLSQPEFALLIDDPRHQVRLRQYEALSWRRHGASVVVPSVLFLVGAVLSIALVWG